jgi:hypothetical protein
MCALVQVCDAVHFFVKLIRKRHISKMRNREIANHLAFSILVTVN